MDPTSAVVLHGGTVLEITLLEYLFRVALSLFAFGGLAVIIFWGAEGVSAIRTGAVEKWSSGENDP